MLKFSIAQHKHIPGVLLVEVHDESGCIAAIYPSGEKGLKLVSAHISKTEVEDGSGTVPPIPSVMIEFDPQPWEIRDGKLVKLPPK